MSECFLSLERKLFVQKCILVVYLAATGTPNVYHVFYQVVDSYMADGSSLHELKPDALMKPSQQKTHHTVGTTYYIIVVPSHKMCVFRNTTKKETI